MTTYTYTTLIDPSSLLGSTDAYGINNAGQVVGYYFDSQGKNHGFLYSGGSYTTIDYQPVFPDPAVDDTYALGINDAGQIVEKYTDGRDHGFLYSNGTFTTIDDPLGSPLGRNVARGINKAGQIVGYYDDSQG